MLHVGPLNLMNSSAELDPTRPPSLVCSTLSPSIQGLSVVQMRLEGTDSCVNRINKGHLTTKEVWDSSGGDLVALN